MIKMDGCAIHGAFEEFCPNCEWVPDEDTDDTHREDEPGDWFVADFDGPCSRGGEGYGPGTTVRTDGEGGHECRRCVSREQIGPIFLTMRTGQDRGAA